MNKTKLTILVIAIVAFAAIITCSLVPKITNTNSKNMKAENGDMVSVNYTGKLTDGTVFDSSIPRGKPIQFVLGAGMVIKGWDEGVLGMSIGEKKTLDIPADKAYGSQGVPDGKGGYIIPQNATLTFDVELVDIKRK